MISGVAILLVTQFSVDGQPCSMSCAKVLRCSSSCVTSFISSAVMQHAMSVHDSITIMDHK